MGRFICGVLGRQRTLRLALVLFGAILVLPQVAPANTLIDAWSAVQQSLGNPQESGKLAPALKRLMAEKESLGLERIPTFSRALCYAGVNSDDPKQRLLLFRGARGLDPLLPGPRFLSANDALKDRKFVEALGEFSTGVLNLFRDPPVRRLLAVSLVPWFSLSLVLAVVLTMFVTTLRFFRLIVADAFFLSKKMFSTPNALALATVIVLLPLCAGLGPVWELVYLFALTWIYMGLKERLAGGIMLLLLALLMPVLGFWQQSMLVTPALGSRIENMLEMRVGDFSVLRAFSELSRDLEKSAAFHVVSGELLRMHGDPELSQIEFEKAAVAAPEAALPRLFLGGLALEGRDIPRALEYLNDTVKRDPKNVLAYYDLAIALDLTRRFEEGDTARQRARELSGGHYERVGLPGREENVLFPKIGNRMVRRVLEDSSGFTKISLEGGGRSVLTPEILMKPLVATGIFGLLFGTLALYLRHRFFAPGRACTKCGKVFYPEDKTVYCEQCVTVFLKRNAVSIDQQSTKVAQVRRWELISSTSRRLAGVFCPGGATMASGNCIGGLLLSALVILQLVGALVWVPLYAREIEAQFPWLALQGILVLVGIGLWVFLAVTAWYRR